MGVTFYPSNKKAEPFDWDWSKGKTSAYRPTTSTAELTFSACTHSLHGESDNTSKLHTSSFPMNDVADGKIRPVGNGLVHTVMQAYNCHRHLIIRPDDVWLAILTQFSLFVNANAESLRGSFVSHEGQKNLHVELSCLDIDYLASEMTSLLHENITDPSIREWIMPNFTTTTAVDTTVSSIIMMSTLQKYFTYSCSVVCGLPSVTLEGEKKDYQSILRRIEKLKEYGEETTIWYHLLRPILKRFVGAFDNPSDSVNLDFWNRVVDQRSICGGDLISGWITAFCVFDREGRWVGYPLAACLKDGKPTELYAKIKAGVTYQTISAENIPSGCVEVDIELINTGTRPHGFLIAGLGAFQLSSSKDSAEEMDTVRPVAGWWLAIRDSEAEEAKRLEREKAAKEEQEYFAKMMQDWESLRAGQLINK